MSKVCEEVFIRLGKKKKKKERASADEREFLIREMCYDGRIKSTAATLFFLVKRETQSTASSIKPDFLQLGFLSSAAISDPIFILSRSTFK